MEFKPATCPNCAGELQIPANLINAICNYCGTSIMVREAIHAAGTSNLSTWLKLANVAITGGNFAEAYSYFTKILEVDSQNYEAWFGKGEAAGWMSLPEQSRLSEMLALFRAAVEHSPVEIRPRMIARTNAAIAVITVNAYRKACEHVAEQPESKQDTHADDCLYMVNLVEQAHKYAPQDRQIIESLFWMCRDILDSEHYPVTRSGQDGPWVDMQALQLNYEQRKAMKQRAYFYENIWKQLPG